jgi:hypothetical protein
MSLNRVSRAQVVGITRQTTRAFTFVDNAQYPGRLQNATTSFRQLQVFFDTVQWTRGVEYSFIKDVLEVPISPRADYLDTPNGYAYGQNAGAVLLNMLVYNAAFWDVNGIEKPLFLRIKFDIQRFDRSYDVYGVTIRKPAQDYVWRLNPAYDGAAPRIRISFDATAQTPVAAISADYEDEQTPPSRKLSLKEKGEILGANLREIIGDKRLGVSIVPLASPADTVDVNAEIQIPVASAWKGGAIIYFFENIEPTVWGSLPIQYWNIRNINRVPREHQDAFAKHNAILRWMYVAGVFSGNHEAGNVIDYVWRYTKNPKIRSAQNAIMAFNDWSREVVKITEQSGIHRWLAGATESTSIIDYRLPPRQFLDRNGRTLRFDNTYSPHDMALYYLHLGTIGREKGYYDTAMELLSTKTDILSVLKGYANGTGIKVASKIGYFFPDSPSAYGHDVNTDAGLLTLPNGEQYAVATMAFDTVPLQGDVLCAVMRSLLNLYQSAP